MSNDPKPRNGESTKQFALRVGIVVAAILVLAVVYGLFAGIIVVPAETQAQVWGGIGILIGGAFLIANTYMQARSTRLIQETNERTARINREAAAHQAEMSRQHSDENAAETRSRVAGTEQKVTTLIARVEDGLGGKIAGIVKGDAEKAAEALRIRQMEEENIALRAKLETLQSAAPALVLPVPLVAPAQSSPLPVPLPVIVVGSTVEPATAEPVQPTKAAAQAVEATADALKAMTDQAAATVENSEQLEKSTQAIDRNTDQRLTDLEEKS